MQGSAHPSNATRPARLMKKGVPQFRLAAQMDDEANGWVFSCQQVWHAISTQIYQIYIYYNKSELAYAVASGHSRSSCSCALFQRVHIILSLSFIEQRDDKKNAGIYIKFWTQECSKETLGPSEGGDVCVQWNDLMAAHGGRYNRNQSRLYREHAKTLLCAHANCMTHLNFFILVYKLRSYYYFCVCINFIRKPSFVIVVINNGWWALGVTTWQVEELVVVNKVKFKK